MYFRNTGKRILDFLALDGLICCDDGSNSTVEYCVKSGKLNFMEHNSSAQAPQMRGSRTVAGKSCYVLGSWE